MTLLHRASEKRSLPLMESLGVDTVRERLDEVERLIAGKKVPGPGFFVSFIRSPDDYRLPPARQQVAVRTQVAAPPRLLEAESDPDQAARERFASLSAIERAQETVRSLRVVYGNRLDAGEYRKLGDVLEVEALDASLLRAEAARALTMGTCDNQVALLRVQLATFS
ncbi:hypothetical protein ACFQDE_18730 [Deinococcus caeni]|uniref:Uncharacterized protein n=1 Tax=Deinococcus caeni TaxID=569127 RepID=A0ABP9UHZ9_9DEIO